MTIHIAQQIGKAFQACNVWTEDTPGDAANGITSTTWAPVHAEINRLAPASAPRADKLAAYSQVVADLRRARSQMLTSRKLGPSERSAFAAFLQLLLANYEPLLANT